MRTILSREFNKKREENNVLTKFMLKIVLIVALVFLFVLLVMNVNHSITFDEVGSVIFLPQKFSAVMLRSAVIALILILSRRVKLIVGKKLFYIMSFLYFLANVFLVFGLSLHPTYDQYYMTWIASDMLRGGIASSSPMDIWTYFRFSIAS